MNGIGVVGCVVGLVAVDGLPRNTPPVVKPPEIPEIAPDQLPPKALLVMPAICERIGPTPGMNERNGAAMPRIFENKPRFFPTCSCGIMPDTWPSAPKIWSTMLSPL